MIRVIALTVLLAMAFPAFGQMTLPGKFEVTDTGSASYTIPISVVPGTAGLEPKLSLQYDSRGGNGLLGVGWSLAGLPAITRCGRTIAQDGAVGGVSYDANDRFCLDGQRLIATSGTYGADQTEYRTERESFSKVVSYGSAGSGPAWFKVWTKAGLIMEFGNTADSRIEAQGKASVRVWAINKTSDTKGNWFSVSYTEDNTNGEYRPARIDYTGNGSTAPANSVRFVYETRPDIVPLYQAGSLIKTTQRMTKVQAWQGEDLVREHRIDYQLSPSTQRSRTAGIAQCDRAAVCLPTQAISWSNVALAFAAPQIWVANDFTVGTGWTNQDAYPRLLADVTGDGLPDIIGFGGQNVRVAQSTGTGFTAAPVWLAQDMTYDYGWTGQGSYPRDLVDVNGDGLADIAGFSGQNVRVALSTGAAFGAAPIWLAQDFTYDYGWTDDGVRPRMLADVNGDGRADIVGFANVDVRGALSSGAAFVSPQSWVSGDLTVQTGWANQTVYPRMLADVTGDGLPDIVGFGGQNVRVAQSTGTGFTAAPVWLAQDMTVDYAWSNQSAYPRMLADVNGDGLADIVGFSGQNVRVALSTGTSFTAATVWLAGAFTYDYGWTDQNTKPRMLADVNGDGLADIVAFDGNNVMVALSTGSGFMAPQVWYQNDFGTGAGWTNQGEMPRMLADVNGDGRADIIGFSGVNVRGVVASTASGARPDILTAVGAAATGLTQIAYSSLTVGALLYAKDAGASACAYPCQDIQGPLYVVSEVKSSNGLGGEYRSTYRYAGAKADQHGRGFLGFRQMVVKDEQTGVEQVTSYRPEYPFTGLVASREKKLGALVLNRSTNTYADTNLGGTRRYPFLTQSLEESWELSGAALPAVTTSYQYDAFGNATQVSVSTGDGHSKTTVNTYSNDSANWLLGRLTRSEVTSTTPGN